MSNTFLQKSTPSGGPCGRSSCPGLLLLLVCCLLVAGMASGCRKKPGGAISNPPLLVATPAEPVEKTGEPELDRPGENVSTPIEAPTHSATPWMMADEAYRRHNLEQACIQYREMRQEQESAPLPSDVAVRSILACSVGSPEDRKLAGEWLEQWNASLPPGEDSVPLMVVSRLLEELQTAGRAVAERDARLAQINQELEKLKKIDSLRRRP